MPYVKVCPKCGSENVRQDYNKLLQFYVPPTSLCVDCGFSGQLFPEIEKDAPEDDADKSRKKHK